VTAGAGDVCGRPCRPFLETAKKPDNGSGPVRDVADFFLVNAYPKSLITPPKLRKPSP
jgi:hypothetical protein